MCELLNSIIKQFNNVLLYDSRYFKVLVLDPLLMNNNSFLALYKETVELYNSDVDFKEEPPMQKNVVLFSLMLFACRRKSIADGHSQLDFYKMIYREGMLQNRKIFTELIIPWLKDFRIIRESPTYSSLLDNRTYQIPIVDVPIHGEFAIRMNKKINDLEIVRHWWWTLFCT